VRKKLAIILGISFLIVLGRTLMGPPKKEIFPGQTLGGNIAFESQVSARIGEKMLNLSGYTSPFAQVTLYLDDQVPQKTIANSLGFFIFADIFLPQNPPIPCLVAVDTDDLATPPLCLARLPANADSNVENILLPPTISVGQEKIPEGNTIAARGATFPNSKVRMFLFRKEKPRQLFPFNFKFLAFAMEGPPLEVKSDDRGYFEFNLPSTYPTTYRIFLGSERQDNPSPKSNTLTFYVLSFWEHFWERLKQFFLCLANLLYQIITDPEKIIFLEIPLLCFLILHVIYRTLVDSLVYRERGKISQL